jgi:hypothetical protein
MKNGTAFTKIFIKLEWCKMRRKKGERERERRCRGKWRRNEGREGGDGMGGTGCLGGGRRETEPGCWSSRISGFRDAGVPGLRGREKNDGR